MQNGHPLTSFGDQNGLLTRTVNWLRHRNRLHAPDSAWVTKAGAPGAHVAVKVSASQVPAEYVDSRRVAAARSDAARSAAAPPSLPPETAGMGRTQRNWKQKQRRKQEHPSPLPAGVTVAVQQAHPSAAVHTASRRSVLEQSPPPSWSRQVRPLLPTAQQEGPNASAYSPLSPPPARLVPWTGASAASTAAAVTAVGALVMVASDAPRWARPPSRAGGDSASGMAPVAGIATAAGSAAGGGGGGPAARLGGAALSAAIRAATSLDQLADLYDIQCDAFRSGHVSAALARLPHAAGLRIATIKPRLTALRHERLLEQLLDRFLSHRAAGEYGTRDLSSVAWVLGTLGRRERAATVAELADHMLALRRRHVRQQQQGWLAAAGVSGEDDAAAAAAAPGRTSDCSPVDLSNMALGMAKAGVTSPVLWQELTASAAAAALAGFGAQETANFAWSLAQAHREYYRHETAATAAAGAAAAGSTARGCNDYDWQYFAAWPAECSGSGGGAKPAAQPPPSPPRALHPAWRPWAEDFVEGVLAPRVRLTLARYSPQQAANAAWALVALGHADGRTLAAVAAAAEVAATAALPHPAGPAVPPQAGAVWRMRRTAPSLTPQGACMFVWAMATMVNTWRGRIGSGGEAMHDSSSCSGSSNLSSSREVQVGRSQNPRGIGSRSQRSASVSDGRGASNGCCCSSRGSGSGSSSIGGEARNSSGKTNSSACSINSCNGCNSSLGTGSMSGNRSFCRAAAGGVGVAGARYPDMSHPVIAMLPSPLPASPLSRPLAATPPLPAAVPRTALLALARFAGSRIDRFTAQGVSNLLWGLGALGFQGPREVLEQATHEALLRLPELLPLDLVTLLEDWARARRYNPALFAAAAPLAAATLMNVDGGGGGGAAWRPRTVARLLRAYGAVGHVDRRLFVTAAAVLVPDYTSGSAEGMRRAASGGAAASLPLDELEPAELYQLACAYGRVGVHAPRLMDVLLARLAPLLTRRSPSGDRMPPRAAGRLLCALAVVGHRPAMEFAVDDGGGAYADGAAAAFHALRWSVLSGLTQMTSRHALTAVWSLVRLQAAGTRAVWRLARLLVQRVTPSAACLAEGMVAVVRTPTVAGSPQTTARLVWLLGRGAAAAAARLQAAAMDGPDGRGGSSVGIASKAEARAAAVALLDLGGALLAVADKLVGEAVETHEDANGEVLAALAAALAAVLASPPPPPPSPPPRASHGAGGYRQAVKRLYDASCHCFLTVAERALCLGASPAAAASLRLLPKPRAFRLSTHDLTVLVYAMCDSGAAAAQPAMRTAAARQVLYRLQAVAVAGFAGGPAPGSAPAAAVPPSPASPPAGGPPRGGVLPPPQRPAGWQQQLKSPPNQQPPPPPHPRLSADDAARLLAAAARLGLFEEPSAQPLLRNVARRLVSYVTPAAVSAAATTASAPAATTASAPAATKHHVVTAAGAAVSLGTAGSPTGNGATSAAPAAALSLCHVSPAALQDLIMYCRSTVDGSNGGRADSGRGVGVGSGGGGSAEVSGGLSLRAALGGWAAQQALTVLPWLRPEVRAQGGGGGGGGGGFVRRRRKHRRGRRSGKRYRGRGRGRWCRGGDRGTGAAVALEVEG